MTIDQYQFYREEQKRHIIEFYILRSIEPFKCSRSCNLIGTDGCDECSIYQIGDDSAAGLV
jgi:hypothetical protein